MLKPTIFKMFLHLLLILLFIGLIYFLVPLLGDMVISNYNENRYTSPFLESGFLFIVLLASLLAGLLAYFFAGLLAGLSAGVLVLSWNYFFYRGVTSWLIFLPLQFFVFIFSIYHLRKKKGKWKVKYPFLIWYCLIFINVLVPSCFMYILTMTP